MTKQKKVIWIILGIIIFVFSVFLGLGYLGQITGGNSLIQRTEMNDKYVPEEITKYYPIENLNSKENLLSGRIEFISDENPITDLLNGVLSFHNYITPPLPAEQIISKIEIDTDGYNKLF